MRHERVRGGEFVRVVAIAIAVTAACAAPSARAEVGLAWSRVFGAGSVALETGAFGNPAGLGGLTRHGVQLGQAVVHGAPATQQGGVAWVPERGPRCGLGFERARVRDGATRDAWSLRVADLRGARFGWGGALRLQEQHRGERLGSSWGADLGVALGSARRLEAASGPAWRAGLGLENAVRPLDPWSAAAAREPRRLVLGAAWTHPWSRELGVLATCGIAFEHGARARGGPGIGIAWRRGLQLAAAVEAGDARFGAAVRRGDWSFEVATRRGAAPEHTLAVRTDFGATRDARRAAAAERDAAVFAARVETTWRTQDEARRRTARDAERAALVQRADSLVSRAQHAAAATLLEDALERFPADSLLTRRLTAVRDARGAADLTRSRAGETFLHGVEAFAAQDFLAAARAFDAVLGLDPAHALAGEFLQRARAAHQAQRAAALASARGALERQELDAAAREVGVLLQRDSTDAEVRALRARVGRAQDAEARRLADARRAEARRTAEPRRVPVEDGAPPLLAPRDVDAAYERGVQLYRSGDLAGAMRTWESVARSAPQHAEVTRNLLRVYRVLGLERYTEGSLQDAIALWSKALQLEPDNAQVQRYLDQARIKLRRAQSAGGVP